MTDNAPPARPNTKNWRNANPDDRLAHQLKNARRAMERALQLRLIEHHVSFGHWSFLRILWEYDDLTQRELSDLAGMTAPTTSSAINAMEALGYVQRRQKADNKKNVYISVTPKGRALEKKLLPLAKEINEIAVDGLAQADVRIARQVLLKITDNLLDYEQKILEAENRRVPSTQELGRLSSR